MGFLFVTICEEDSDIDEKLLREYRLRWDQSDRADSGPNVSGYFAPAHIAGTAKSRFRPSGELTVKAWSALQLATDRAKVSNGHGAVVGAVSARLNSDAFQFFIYGVQLGR